jgi:hypothetical protein
MALPLAEREAILGAGWRICVLLAVLAFARLLWQLCPTACRRHKALQRQESVESLRWWGGARLCYAAVWLCYRLQQTVWHGEDQPHLLGAPRFRFHYDLLLGCVHACCSAVLLPLVTTQLSSRPGGRVHRLSGTVAAAVTVASLPWNLVLLSNDRHLWWLTTFVELLVLSQWVYHLHGLCRAAGRSSVLHRWHAIQFVRVWLTPVDVRLATAFALVVLTDEPSIATGFGHLAPLLMWLWRLSPRPEAELVRRNKAGNGEMAVVGLALGAIGAALGAVVLVLLWSSAVVEISLLGLVGWILPLGAIAGWGSDRFYDGDPLIWRGLGAMSIAVISPPTALEGISDLAHDLWVLAHRAWG